MISNQKKDAAAKPHQCWFRWVSLSSHSWGRSTVEGWTHQAICWMLICSIPLQTKMHDELRVSNPQRVVIVVFNVVELPCTGSRRWFLPLPSFTSLSHNYHPLILPVTTGLWMKGNEKTRYSACAVGSQDSAWRCQVKKCGLLRGGKVFGSELNTHCSNVFVV